MNWKLMKLGTLLTQSKELSTAPDANRRIRVKLNVGGVEKRPVSNEVEGATNYYIRKAGQFIFGTQNFHKGAFGVIPPELDGFETSNDIPSFDVSKDCLPDWIFFYFKVGDRYKELEKLARGVGSKRVHAKQIFELEIPVPPVAEQLTIIAQVQASAARQRMIVEESEYQLAHLTQLRQALLREAMQGQLLPQNPTDEPAAVLLKKLQAAKDATGKGGKGKAGALFAEEAELQDGPYELPNNWTWYKLDDIASLHNGDRSTNYPSGSELKSEGIPFISTKNIKGNYVDLDAAQLNFITEKKFLSLSGGKLADGDLLMCLRGSVGKVGLFRKNNLFTTGFINAQLVIIRPYEVVKSQFLLILLSNAFFQAQVIDKSSGSAQPQISAANLKKGLIPLPPLAEQHRIVAKLEQLLQHCDALEQRIRASRHLAEQLLATALREALAPPAGTELAEEVETELVEVEVAPAALRRGRPLKKRLATNDPDLFSELADSFGVE